MSFRTAVAAIERSQHELHNLVLALVVERMTNAGQDGPADAAYRLGVLCRQCEIGGDLRTDVERAVGASVNDADYMETSKAFWAGAKRDEGQET